jgi:hypothetical protein
VNATNSYHPGLLPVNAVDGQENTGWYSKDITIAGIGYNYWMIDFQTVRWISSGWIHNTMWAFPNFQIWTGMDRTFPCTNTLMYTYTVTGSVSSKTFPVDGYGRYLYVANQMTHFGFEVASVT